MDSSEATLDRLDAASRRHRRAAGDSVPTAQRAAPPDRSPLVGHRVKLEPIDADLHGAELYAASHGAADGALWDYMAYGPFDDAPAMAAWLRACAGSPDPIFLAVRDGSTSRPAGMASYLAIRPASAVMEIGNIWLAPSLQRTAAATETLFLMMRNAFDSLGYRRLEWKCDVRNILSCRAALRLGFRHEGMFLNHMIIKGRNRDTAWYALIDSEWPAVRTNFERWLAPGNFDGSGTQRTSLAALNQAMWAD